MGEGIGEALEGLDAPTLPNTHVEGLHQPPASKKATHLDAIREAISMQLGRQSAKKRRTRAIATIATPR